MSSHRFRFQQLQDASEWANIIFLTLSPLFFLYIPFLLHLVFHKSRLRVFSYSLLIESVMKIFHFTCKREHFSNFSIFLSNWKFFCTLFFGNWLMPLHKIDGACKWEIKKNLREFGKLLLQNAQKWRKIQTFGFSTVFTCVPCTWTHLEHLYHNNARWGNHKKLAFYRTLSWFISVAWKNALKRTSASYRKCICTNYIWEMHGRGGKIA